ncbi:MAG: cytochrome c oxidase subunit I, partial [Nitrososphaeraceae archaeon]
LGLYGMPRRVYDFVDSPELVIMNQIATAGAFTVGISYVIMVANMLRSAGKGKAADMKDPFKIEEEYYDYRRREPPIHD